MSKFHFISLIFFCVFYTQCTHAQNITLEPMQCSVCPPPQTNKFNKTLTIYYDGNDGYSTPGGFVFWITNNNSDTFIHTFNSPGSHTFSIGFNQSFGYIGY